MSRSNFIKEQLESGRIESVQGNKTELTFGKRLMYRVKKNHSLQFTGDKMVWDRWCYTRYEVDYIFPENSLFWCEDNFCQNLYTRAEPEMKNERKVGVCFGLDCIRTDFERMKKLNRGIGSFELYKNGFSGSVALLVTRRLQQSRFRD